MPIENLFEFILVGTAVNHPINHPIAFRMGMVGYNWSVMGNIFPICKNRLQVLDIQCIIYYCNIYFYILYIYIYIYYNTITQQPTRFNLKFKVEPSIIGSSPYPF